MADLTFYIDKNNFFNQKQNKIIAKIDLFYILVIIIYKSSKSNTNNFVFSIQLDIKKPEIYNPVVNGPNA